MDDRYVRALDRAHALADLWSDDRSLISRAEAAELLSEVLRLDGWMVSEPAGARLRLVPAAEAPEPHTAAHEPPDARRGPVESES
ncbi:hypothetical protein [Streptomyces sparsogenes]|uniref:hypothetical protein n=1 Tax=Streptomyces sparsogenes TaxID=67365 RepID=UPI003400B1EB